MFREICCFCVHKVVCGRVVFRAMNVVVSEFVVKCVDAVQMTVQLSCLQVECEE